ncbi:MAG: ADP-ribosylglycohydrolase family protein, partial [Actinobacteria bacterium]|nr:ADP-ribosylglycohydrolase family protein [Actinomycetota bacterium]
MTASVGQLDRAVGTLMGLATGDALGAGYEFQSHPPSHPEMIGGGSFRWEPGEWTDDTQMALCIAEITQTGSSDPEAIGERFLEWYRSHPKDVGNQTRAVLGAASNAADLEHIARARFEASPNNSAGNGSLMRTAAVALAHLGDDAAMSQTARTISDLTHGDPLAGEACVLWCAAIDRAVREQRMDGIHDGLALLPASSRDRWANWIQEAESSPPPSFKPNGFVVKALQAAHAAITQTPVPAELPCVHLQDALRTAVAIGHDTDTVAAIAGSLLGARWGGSAVPLRWRRLLHGWPGYRARDLMRLAVMTLRGGEEDSVGWPIAKRLIPYYKKTFRPAGSVVALPDHPSVFIGDVAGLETMDDSVDAVLSLCRMGTEEGKLAAREHHEIWLVDSNDPKSNPNLDFVLQDLAEWMVERRDEGRSIFIHCVRAENRTPTVAAAYLAKSTG